MLDGGGEVSEASTATHDAAIPSMAGVQGDDVCEISTAARDITITLHSVPRISRLRDVSSGLP